LEIRIWKKIAGGKRLYFNSYSRDIGKHKKRFDGALGSQYRRKEKSSMKDGHRELAQSPLSPFLYSLISFEFS
jgi:hypothetical protein